MSAALMTLFAVSIVGALGMAVYGLRVLLGRWEKPRRPKVLLSVAPVNQLQPQPAPMQPQVWVHPTAGAPMPMAPLAGVATPPPLRLPSPGYAPPPPSFVPQALPSPAPVPPSFAPPAPSFAAPSAPTWTPPARATSLGHAAARPAAARATTRPATPERLARGSIPPDFSGDLELDLEPEPDTDPGVPEMPETEARVQRGARFSVIRSSRR